MSKDVTIEVPTANVGIVANPPIPVSADTPASINMDDYMSVAIPRRMLQDVMDVVRAGLDKEESES